VGPDKRRTARLPTDRAVEVDLQRVESRDDLFAD
jgi:hypothetical protein